MDMSHEIKCENDVVLGPCFENKFGCQNGGTCVLYDSEPRCLCDEVFYGIKCENSKCIL